MRFWRTVLSRAAFTILLALLVVLSVIMPMGQVLADDNGGVVDLSLYQRASELTREFATALSPGSEVERMYMLETSKGGENSLLVAGNAGAMLGYAEILADDKGIVGWLMNSYTAASATISYDQLMHVVDVGGDGVGSAVTNNPFYQYAGYGEILTEMGLIGTIRPGLGEMGRTLATGLMLGVYLLANVAPFLFRGALMILVTLNPFRLFETAINGTASADLGVISGVAEYVGSMYSAIQDLSIVVIMPMLLAFTVFSALVFQKGSSMKKFARYGVRIFMLFAGLPLIGATYTGVVNDLETKVAVGSEYADYLVLSSYVDFENWVKYSRLAPPEDKYIGHPRMRDDEDRSITNRSMILEINGTRAANTRANELKKRYSATSDIGKIFSEGGQQYDVDEASMSGESKSSFSTVFNMLTRHMNSARYTSSDYDGEVSGQIQKIRNAGKSDAKDEAIVKMFTLSASDNRSLGEKLKLDWFEDEADKWNEPVHWNGEDDKGKNSAKGLFTEGYALNPLFRFGPYEMNIYNSGDLRYEAGKGYISPATPAVVSKKTAPIGSSRGATVGGMSPISMYNFLNTTFSKTGLTVYSPSKTASDLSRDSYAAVVFGGSGISSFTKWVENFVVMACLSILSIAFGVIMISVSIQSIPRILSGVFGTAFGSIAFITKLLISTAVLIIQILGMIFFYTLSENIMMTMLLNFNSIVDVGGEYFRSGLIFEFLGSFLVVVVAGALTFFMIKNAKIFKEMMEEVVSNAINRLMSALDTGTGGRGLDVAKTSGGRIGNDGKLTDEARAPKGVMGLLGAAHDIEAKREQAAQEEGLDLGGVGAKMGRRWATAKDLMGARSKDTVKGLGGVEGKSLEREMAAKEHSIRGLQHNKDAQERFEATSRGGSNEDAVNADELANAAGQQVDENGEVITDSNGNALDAHGNVISASAPLAMAGLRPMVAEDSTLTDADGNTYMDEMGNAFYQNDKGQLTDADGNFVALDKDGTLQPIASIPGHNGKPVSAAKEAKKLDAMRYDSAKYGAMQDQLEASHYGLDKDGNVVGSDGKGLFADMGNGKTSGVSIDSQGFVVDDAGNRVPANAVLGAVDSRGFEKVTDPETGETHLRHKGDAAMKHAAKPIADNSNHNLTSLAAQSNKADALAERAEARVNELKENGAPPYAVMQAQRFADSARKNAQVSQNNFNKAMEETAQGTRKGSQSMPVTNEHVASATRHAETQQAALRENAAKLSELKAQGASPQAIAKQGEKLDKQKAILQQNTSKLSEMQKQGAPKQEIAKMQNLVDKQQASVAANTSKLENMKKQGPPKHEVAQLERKVEAQRESTAKAVSMAQDVQLAKQTGRSFGEVSHARNRVETAERKYGEAFEAHAQAVTSGQPPQVVERHEKRLNQASKLLANAHANAERIAQPPSGSRQQIDQATAKHSKAQADFQQATRNVERLVRGGGSPQEIQQAKRQQTQAARKLNQAQTLKQKLTNPSNWESSVQPKIQRVPEVSPAESYTKLASHKVTNYSDYSREVKAHAATVRNKKSELRQAEQRLAAYRKGNRPPQIVEQALKDVNTLKHQIQHSEKALRGLQDNAQGLLKTGAFQPIVANKPIRKNGGELINQMIHMSHAQGMYDKLASQQKAGTLSESGRSRMKTLGNRLNQMRRDLTAAGIREDALASRDTLVESTQHMQQSWESFVNGDSREADS